MGEKGVDTGETGRGNNTNRCFERDASIAHGSTPMKIDQNIQYQTTMLNNTQKNAATRSGKETSSSGKPDGAAFSVTISKTAGNLMKATELLAKAPSGEDEIRQEKVAAIKDRLASGSYNISGKDVATKILNALKG